MFTELLRRLRDRISFRSRPRSDPPPPQTAILRTLSQLIVERNMLEEHLTQATNTIRVQDALLAEYDRLLDQSHSRLPEYTEVIGESTDIPLQTPDLLAGFDLGWIETVWLCSSHNAELLGEVEDEWQNGNPQLALVMATNIISNPDLTSLERLKCCSFIAALLHFLGRYDDSNHILDDVLQMTRQNLVHAQAVGGIAQFIRGKNMMAQGDGNGAYWAFAGALYTPGYHEKAQQLQRDAINSCARERAVPDD